MEYLWLMVTNDEYELPLAVADSAFELADMVGINASSIYEMMSKYKKVGRRCPYVNVKFKNGEISQWKNLEESQE